MTDSRFICRMDSLACAIRAAVKVAGNKELAYVRFYRLNQDTLAISALGMNASFRAKVKVQFSEWNENRDYRVEMSKHAAASLAGYVVKTPEGLDAEPTVSVTIGDEKIRVEDATGLFQTAGGRDEHRLADPVLPGDHERIFTDAAIQSKAPFWITPDALSTIAGVAKVLRRRIVMWVRSEPEEATSRWYVHGDDWQMTVSHKERDRALPPTDDDGPAYDDGDNQDGGDGVRRLVIAAPAGGIA